MPCLFNIKLEPFLPNNFQLAVSVLKSIKHKFGHQLEKFTAYDEVIQGQIENGIIEPVEGINSLKYNKILIMQYSEKMYLPLNVELYILQICVINPMHQPFTQQYKSTGSKFK